MKMEKEMADEMIEDCGIVKEYKYKECLIKIIVYMINNDFKLQDS